MEKLRSRKTFRGLSCAHRRWRHAGHCSLVHGYDRTVTIWFEADATDENGFVMDFGRLKGIQKWLESHFDHTLLIDDDDPLKDEFQRLASLGACRLITLPDVGMEGSARFIANHVHQWVKKETNGRVGVYSVEVAENEKNSAMFQLN